MSNDGQPLTLLVCALGGEGGGVLSEWLYETAVHCGHYAQTTAIPGVAQRSGATTYYVEVDPRPMAERGGRCPVFSLNPVPGALDLLVSSELLESVRQIGNGMSAPERTRVISSSARTLTTIEKMALGDGRLDDAQLVDIVQRYARAADVLDMSAMARQAGTVISAVLLGAIAGAGVLPFPRSAYEDTIRRGGKGTEASLRGFGLAYDALTRGREQREAVLQAAGQALAVAQRARTLPPAVEREFPAALHEILGLALARLREYQDARYAERYLERLRRVLAAERGADPQGAQGHAATREAARYLALWMAFDDIVRVADLKLRASRMQRVRREVAARDDEIVKVWDHFKPGLPEFAALLPHALAERLRAWDARRRQRGQAPVEFPLKVGVHTASGALMLRALASLRWLRRRGSRFAYEQAMIERWLAAVERGLRTDWALGHELAQCGRLIKGYGATNERGKENLLHVIDHLAVGAAFATPAERAAAIGRAREAALQDEGGLALDRTLAQLGAPARPVKAQPILWMKNRAAAGGARRAAPAAE